MPYTPCEVDDKVDMSMAKCDSVPGAALAAEGCPSVPVCHTVQPRTHVGITDGGGNGSTAAWLVPQEAQEQHDTLQPLRQRILRLVAEWCVLSRLATTTWFQGRDFTLLGKIARKLG